jgi:hypothetical protein
LKQKSLNPIDDLHSLGEIKHQISPQKPVTKKMIFCDTDEVLRKKPPDPKLFASGGLIVT